MASRLEQSITQLTHWVRSSARVVVLTGAGMSTESGIPDFRSAGGVWEDRDLLNMMTDQFLHHHPEAFWPPYKRVFMNPQYLSAAPNAGHRALHGWEAERTQVHIYTQNVDGLHQQAGSQHVFELHGSARYGHCPRCRHRYGMEHLLAEEVPRCTWETPKGAVCDTILHPDTVLFGQAVRHLDTAILDVQACDLLVVLGTSLTVDPVASLPSYRKSTAKLVIINLDETYLDSEADMLLHEQIGQILPLVSEG